jgi:hypothetical protein
MSRDLALLSRGKAGRRRSPSALNFGFVVSFVIR